MPYPVVIHKQISCQDLLGVINKHANSRKQMVWKVVNNKSG